MSELHFLFMATPPFPMLASGEFPYIFLSLELRKIKYVKQNISQPSHHMIAEEWGGPLGPPFLCNHVFRCQNLHHNTPKMA